MSKASALLFLATNVAFQLAVSHGSPWSFGMIVARKEGMAMDWGNWRVR